MSVAVDLTTRGCTTPGCEGEGVRNVAGLPFCQDCLDACPHKILRGIAQRAEMRRQAAIEADRQASALMDELADRRRKRDREEQQARELAAMTPVTPRMLDGRTRAVLTLKRLQAQAERRKDPVLAAGLARAVDAVADELMGRAS